MIRRSVLLATAALIAPIAACGDSGESSRPADPADESTVTKETFTLSADRIDGATILGTSDDSLLVSVPDSALPDGLDPSTITAVVQRATAGDSGIAVEFELGPDGTTFDEPVTLSWTGVWDPDGTVGIAAVSADGTNLLLTSADADEVLKTLQVVPNSDGTSTVSVEVDHFSTWMMYSFSGMTAIQNRDRFLWVDYEYDQDWDEFSMYAAVSESWRDSLKGSLRGETEVCLRTKNVDLGDLRGSTAAKESCHPSGPALYIDASCPRRDEDFSTTISMVAEVSFAMANTSPFAMVFYILSGTEITTAKAEGAWASASDVSAFMRIPIREEVLCKGTAPSTSTVTTTTVADSDSTTTTSRPESTGSTSKTTLKATTTTTAAPTTTTIKATTTTKPRQGATTTLPRPTPGGTTTLP